MKILLNIIFLIICSNSFSVPLVKEILYVNNEINIDTLKVNYDEVIVNYYPYNFKDIKGLHINYLLLTSYNKNIYDFLEDNIVSKVTFKNVPIEFIIDDTLKCIALEIINSNIRHSFNLFNIRELVLKDIKNDLFEKDIKFNGSYLEVNNCGVTKIPIIFSKDTMNFLIFENCGISNVDNVKYINTYSLTLSKNNINKLPEFFKQKKYYYLDLDFNNLDSVINLNVFLGLDLSNNKIRFIENIRAKVLFLNNNQIDDPEDIVNVFADRIELKGNPIAKDANKMKKLRKKMRNTEIVIY